MDFAEPFGVAFHGVADKYTVAHGESISCNYTVAPSISSGVRDLVGIFPVGWQSTAECITYQFAPLPVEYNPDQAVDCCISFDSDRLVALVRQAVTCHFCYISGTNKVQGMSSPFQLIPAVPSMEMEQDITSGNHSMSKSMSFDTSEDIDDDFVEVEDEDGEIVIIKSKTTFLEEELIKSAALAKAREITFETEKVSLLRQLDAAQSEVERLAEENHSLQQMVSDSERRRAVTLSEMQRQLDAAVDENSAGRRQCEQLRREMLSLQQRLHEAERSRALMESSVAATAAAAEAASAYHSIPASSSLPDALSHNDVLWWPDRSIGLGSAESVAHDLIVGRATSRPRHIPIPAGGASGSRAATGVEPRLPDVISCSSTSPSSAAGIVSSPSGRPIVTKVGWKEKLSGVGLNMFCHLRNAMDPFGADQFGTDVDEVCEMDRYSIPDRSPDGAGAAAGCSHSYHERTPTILRPPTSSSRLHPSVIHCPFCQYPIYSTSGSETSPQQQLLEHLLHTNCGGSSGSDPAQ